MAFKRMNTRSQYQHGGSPQFDLARFDLQERAVLDFSVNLNYLGPPAIIREKWMEILEKIESYPSVEGDGVAHYYQKKFGIFSQNFLSGNGSTELIYLVPRVLRFKHVVIITPSYHDYERASILAGARVTRFPLSFESKFSFPDMDKLIEVLKNADALWLGRPNNPTGTLVPKEPLLELASKFQDKWFIFDEAFIQFADKWKENSFLVDQPRSNILVIHSLTKFYALAGLRLGGIAGAEEVVSRLRESKEPWTVNGVANYVAPLLLGCGDYEHETRAKIKAERERNFISLEKLGGFTPFPSLTNFIFCQWNKTNSLDDLMGHLLSHGIYVRDCRNFPGLGKIFFRICLRSPSENDKLMSILSSSPGDLGV
jgi:threonine-phosphate decarboxylase